MNDAYMWLTQDEMKLCRSTGMTAEQVMAVREIVTARQEEK